MEIYASMLRTECGIDIGYKASPIVNNNQPTRIIYSCCDTVEEDRVNGCYSCVGCGLVLDDKYYDSNEAQPSKPHLRQTYVTMYRAYKPLTHFREHYRRYAGHRDTDIPQSLLDDLRPYVSDARHPEAYAMVKRGLQQLKNHQYPVRFYDKKYKVYKTKQYPPQKFYKDIFLIVYRMGGIQPDLNHIHANRIYDQYKVVEYGFRQLPTKDRRNMPSHFYILLQLLRLNGHEPHYVIPQLKAERLRCRIEKIYATIINGLD